MARRHIYEYLRNGNDIEAIGDYSSAETIFSFAPEQPSEFGRMIILIEDFGMFSSTEYGNSIALTNGIRVRINRGGEYLYIDGGEAITQNSHWACLAGPDVKPIEFAVGNGFLSIRWTFGNAGHDLSLQAGETFEVVLNDDFTGLVSHRFMLQGYTG